MTNIDFSQLIKVLRQKYGLTQEQLAHELGVSFSTVNSWENGHRQPQPYLRKQLLKMAEGADIAMEDFES